MLPALEFRSLPFALAPHLGVVGVVAPPAQRGQVKKGLTEPKTNITDDLSFEVEPTNGIGIRWRSTEPAKAGG